MPIPDFQTLMLPVLEAGKSEVHVGEVVDQLANYFKLSDTEREHLLPSGKQTTFANRVHWAKSYLGKAGLIELTARGRYTISSSRLKVLDSSPNKIDMKYLEQFPDYLAFRNQKNPNLVFGKKINNDTGNLASTDAALAPDEIIRAAYSEISEALASDLLVSIMAKHPTFFERLVVRLLVDMGYGGTLEEAGRALGKSGDGGVDGVIDEDALGLGRIYVQAKKYAADHPIGAGAIRDFFGALDQFKATKGLFVTTSTFTKDAHSTAERLSKRIVLIDGSRLTNLMIRYDVGCRIVETIAIKKIDEDFFEG